MVLQTGGGHLYKNIFFFQSTSKMGSTKISSTKRLLTRVSSGQSDPTPSTGSTPHKPSTGVTGAEVMARVAEGQQGSEPPVAMEEKNKVGRNSLDVFSPARDGE